eukprot:gene29447-36505_t
MTIYTAGTRRYAEAVAKVIDPTHKYFSNRIVSRTDNPNVKSDGHDKSLERIFLSDSSMAVIIDDREDVWKGAGANHPPGTNNPTNNTTNGSNDSNGGGDSAQLLLARPFIYFNSVNTNQNVVVEANNCSGPTGAAGGNSSNATTAGSNGGAAVGPLTPVISLAGQYPGSILKTVPQTSNEFSEADDQLIRCLEIVREIHTRYYNNTANAPNNINTDTATSSSTSSSSDSGVTLPGASHFLKNITDKIVNRSTDSKPKSSPPLKSLSLPNNNTNSVATILSEMKCTVLAGCTVTFSGIIPTNETKPENHILYKLAVSLGATVSLDLLPRTTHLISINVNTHKAVQCVKDRSGLYIVFL